MSLRRSLSSGHIGYGMPMGMGSETSTLQMNPDQSDPLFPLDTSFLYPFDGTTSMSLDPGGPLPASFDTGPDPDSSDALVAATGRAPYSPDDAAAGTNAPREPLGPGNQGNQSNQNVLTEFTKRRNWPARVVEELQDLLHILDANGRIKHVSPSAERLTGYKPFELGDLFMRDLLHPDDVGVFTSEFNTSIASGAPLRVFYRMRKKDGSYGVFEAVGHAHIAAAKFAPNPNNQTPFCQAVFMMSRPYPTKNAALLDSFLEHKMENERLKRKIAELQKEEQEEAEEAGRPWKQSQETVSPEGSLRFGPTSFSLGDVSTTSRERRTSMDSEAAENLPGTRRASIGTTHADTIEMLTGLRYQEGERSRGITTGHPSAALIAGDVGIAIPMDRDQRSGDKKKKLKMAEEYVCTDCGKSSQASQSSIDSRP
ncbi:uncharacterized protein P884DRAFT_90561 [Thermothelomyces heterothallicus CBS 202.75]|uniref:uncharacterized protein n=1 Tax=Thermothelomyces heterothallicus CBS 202.75 TaxID=1149848 RepID=UPI0037445B7B